MPKTLIATFFALTLSLISTASLANIKYEGAILKNETGLTIEFNGRELLSLTEVFALFEQALNLPAKSITNLDALEEILKEQNPVATPIKVLFTSGEALRAKLNAGSPNSQIDKLNDLLDLLNEIAETTTDADGFPAFDVVFLQ